MIYWKGKPLEDHSYAELTDIIQELAMMLEWQTKRHIKELEAIFGASRR